jgi:hypothetical protein
MWSPARTAALVAALLGHAATSLARESEPYPQFPTRLTTPAAVHTAARLAHALRDPLASEALELPPDVIDDARRACLGAAAGPLPEGVRAEALECAADLGAVVTSFLADESPALRATAVGLLGARARDGLTALAADKDPEVAATALGLLCADDAARTRCPRARGDGDRRGRRRAPHAMPEMIYCFVATFGLMLIFLGWTSGRLGTMSERTPSFRSATTCSASTPSGSVKVRVNEP